MVEMYLPVAVDVMHSSVDDSIGISLLLRKAVHSIGTQDGCPCVDHLNRSDQLVGSFVYHTGPCSFLCAIFMHRLHLC